MQTRLLTLYVKVIAVLLRTACLPHLIGGSRVTRFQKPAARSLGPSKQNLDRGVTKRRQAGCRLSSCEGNSLSVLAFVSISVLQRKFCLHCETKKFMPALGACVQGTLTCNPVMHGDR